MISNTYSAADMSYHLYDYQTPLYQQQGCNTSSLNNATTMGHHIALSQSLTNNKLQHSPSFNSSPKNNSGIIDNNMSYLLASLPNYNNNNNTVMVTSNNKYYNQQLPTTTTITTNSIMNQQQYQHYQPWKLGRASNELMLSHEVMIPSSSVSSSPQEQYNNYYNESNGLPLDSLNNNNNSYYHHHHLSNSIYTAVDNNSSGINQYYSSPLPLPSLSVSSSTSTSIFNNNGTNYQGTPSTSYNNQLFFNDINHHYRRSSINTSRSSSPSTSSHLESPMVGTTRRRSPSPAGNKRYTCRLCNKRFTRPSSLTTHIYSHTGEKPFTCPVKGCHRNFSVVSNLRRHAKVHAGGNYSNNTHPKGSTSSSY